MNNKILFTDWFDPDNIDHIKSFVTLMETGVWPKGFIPKNVEMDVNWYVRIMIKMGDYWVKQKMLGNVPQLAEGQD